MRLIVLLLGAGLFSPSLRAEGWEELPGLSPFEETERWRVGGAALWSTSPALPQRPLAIGALAQGFRRVGDSPLWLGARLSWARSDERSEAWQLRHDHLGLSAWARLESPHRVGLLFAQLGAGLLTTMERARRPEYERLEAMGLSDVQRRSWTLGPAAALEVGVSVRVRGRFAAELSGGPAFSALKVNGAPATHLGLQATLGVSHAF